MNIVLIKESAKEYLKMYKSQFIKVLGIILILQTIPEVFDDFEIFSSLGALFTIAFIPISHGIIVTSLKIIKRKDINSKDAFIGIQRYKDLFPTYIALSAVLAIVFILPAIIVVGIMITMINNYSIDLMNIDYSNLLNTIIQYLINNPHYIIILIIIYLSLLAIGALVDGYMLAVPYLLEEYNVTGFKAIKESFNLMRGHMKDYLKLYLSFIPWILIFAVLRISSYIFLEFHYMTLVAFVIGIIEILTYRPTLILSQTILYNEIKNKV